MKVYIVHGWDGSPSEPMLQWLRTSLEARDYDVSIPMMPDTDHPVIESWVEKLTKLISPDENTILIGHSIGCQAILRYLQTLPAGKKIKGIVLVAPWMALSEKAMKRESKKAKEIARPWMETPIDFAKVKTLVGKTIAIFSDNDPYVALEQKDIFEKELGAQIIIQKKKGHFTAKDGIIMLPSALNATLDL